MLVSVIIPCYNAVAVIERAVASAFAQMHRPLEVICVDDGSTDGTPEVLAQLQKQHPELQVIRQPNGGAPRARNTGLAASTGEYVQFLDADDELDPRKVGHHIDIASRAGVGMVVGEHYYHMSDGTTRRVEAFPHDPWMALPRVRFGNTPSVLIRKEWLTRVGGWREDLTSTQEYDLFFRLLKSGISVAFDSEALVHVYQTAGSISESNRARNAKTRIRWLSEIRDYLLESGYSDEYLQNTNAALFDVVRELYKYEPSESVAHFRRYFASGYQPGPSLGTTRAYCTVYRFLGFEGAQRMSRWLKRVRS